MRCFSLKKKRERSKSAKSAIEQKILIREFKLERLVIEFFFFFFLNLTENIELKSFEQIIISHATFFLCNYGECSF